MTPLQHSTEVQSLLQISQLHLLGQDAQAHVQHYQQLWHAAERCGDRAALHRVRQSVVAAGRKLQPLRSDPQVKMLWLALMGLRCSMLMPRMRF